MSEILMRDVSRSGQMLSFQVAATTITDLDHRLDVDEHDEVVADLERPVIARA